MEYQARRLDSGYAGSTAYLVFCDPVDCYAVAVRPGASTIMSEERTASIFSIEVNRRKWGRCVVLNVDNHDMITRRQNPDHSGYFHSRGSLESQKVYTMLFVIKVKMVKFFVVGN
jgi:hypothetical protein